MKRIISLLTAVLLLVGQAAYASEITDSKAYFDITSLGIMTGDEEGNMNLEKALTRAEFAAVITRLIGLEDAAKVNVSEHFSDVSADSWFRGYVGLMNDMQIMNGVSEREFSPDSDVTYEQAMKTLVCVLGYDALAENRGGYPDGYLSVGTSLHLNKGVAMSGSFTRGSLLQMCYNALDIDMITYDKDIKTTLRDVHTNGVIPSWRGKGVVSANFETYLNAPNSSLKQNEVEIDDVVYRVGETDAANYLGQMVEFWALEDEDGKNKIVSIRPHGDNEVTEVLWSDVTKANLNEIEYLLDDKDESIDIDGAKIVKNGRLIMAPKNSDVTATRGTVRFVDRDGDGTAEVVFIDDYQNVRVKSLKEDVIEFREGFLYNGIRFLTVDFDDDDVFYTVLNSEGKEIALEEIAPDSILSISSDSKREVYRLVAAEKSANGVISELSEEEIVVSGEAYPIYSGDSFDVNVGENATVYLDYKGYVADVEGTDSENSYAYVVASEQAGSIAGDLKLKMVVGSKMLFEYEENEDNPDSTDLIPVIKCRNQAVVSFETAEQLKLNGKRIDSNALSIAPGLYSYKMNASGKVSELKSVSEAGGGSGMKYNVYDKAFYQASKSPVAISDGTVVICLPKQNINAGETEVEYINRLAATGMDDYLVPLEISNKDSSVSFEVLGYDLDESTNKAKIVVFYETMQADNVVTVNTNSSPIGMVSAVKTALNENKERVSKVSIVTRSGTEEYLLADIVSGKNDTLLKLKKGDLIYYEIGLSGKLDDAEIIYSFANGIKSFSKNSGTANYQVAGPVVDVKYDQVEATSGNLATVLSVETPSGDVPVSVYQRNVPQMFIYYSGRDKIAVAEKSDLVPGRDESFFALIPLGGKAKACVIYR